MLTEITPTFGKENSISNVPYLPNLVPSMVRKLEEEVRLKGY